MNLLLKTKAVVLEKPENILLRDVDLVPASENDIIVEIEWSGISTGTEKLLWTGQMPSFPGMGYPLVPGYESVGRVIQADAQQRHTVGQRVFVPGSTCFVDVRGLFGGAASRLIVPAMRAVAVAENLGEEVILYALAATAYHVTSGLGNEQPDLIVGHGHSYGLNWYEQKKEGKSIQFIKHPIDPFHSQYHTMEWVDIDNDGKMELITGKRYRAHNSGDPGFNDPLELSYFKWNGESFTKNVISYGEFGKGKGTGIYFSVADLRNTGKKDIILAGKDGLYIFFNE